MNQPKQHLHAWVFQYNPRFIAMLQTLMVRNALMEGHSPFKHACGCTYAILFDATHELTPNLFLTLDKKDNDPC
jgi:hypothetical protein